MDASSRVTLINHFKRRAQELRLKANTRGQSQVESQQDITLARFCEELVVALELPIDHNALLGTMYANEDWLGEPSGHQWDVDTLPDAHW